ncbi:hypothetical protein F4604DRAFT_1675957 [Suillus subluteus]|nr:hypothetical protein F4604DRAFT_1675957 [Suillus subluteus]
MTILYICVRYIGILFAVAYSASMPAIPIQMLTTLLCSNNHFNSLTGVSGAVIQYIQLCIPVTVNAMLGVIMVAQIYAMYQGSKKLLIFLVVALLACTIVSVVMMNFGTLVTARKF